MLRTYQEFCVNQKSLLTGILFSLSVFTVGSFCAMAVSAAETVKSSKAVSRANSSYKTAGESVQEILKNDVFKKKFIEEGVLRKLRELQGCKGPNFEKEMLKRKTPESALTCSSLMTYDGARKKSDDISQLCKTGCSKAEKGTATGKSAAALQKCLAQSCEKDCEFQNLTRKVELDSFIRGALDQNQYDAESL